MAIWKEAFYVCSDEFYLLVSMTSRHRITILGHKEYWATSQVGCHVYLLSWTWCVSCVACRCTQCLSTAMRTELNFCEPGRRMVAELLVGAWTFLEEGQHQLQVWKIPDRYAASRQEKVCPSWRLRVEVRSARFWRALTEPCLWDLSGSVGFILSVPHTHTCACQLSVWPVWKTEVSPQNFLEGFS